MKRADDDSVDPPPPGTVPVLLPDSMLISSDSDREKTEGEYHTFIFESFYHRF